MSRPSVRRTTCYATVTMDKADHDTVTITMDTANQDKVDRPPHVRSTRAVAGARPGLQSAIELLRAHGLTVTPQRLLLVEIARGLPGHFTAKTVHEQVRRTYPGISVVSVYRGLETFRELGLVTRTDLGGANEHYEWASGPRHHHLVCLACGRQQELDDAEMDGLRARLLGHYGFHARIDHHAIFGLCQDCAADHKG